MNDRYYVFNKGRKRGPFSLDDLLDETERGQADYEDLCLRIGDTTCEKVREVLDWEDEHLILTSEQDVLSDEEAEASDADEIKIADLDDGLENNEDDETDDEEFFSDEGEDEDVEEGSFLEESSEVEDDEVDENEELWIDEVEDDEPDEDEEPPNPNQNRPPSDSTTILYSGRPSLLSYPKSLIVVVISLTSGIWFREQFDWILFAGISLALIAFIQAQIRRTRHQYYITPKQVEVIHGLILENSREIRIEDIGAIHIRQRGLQGLLGLASIEFAAVESPMPILVFYNVRAARRIKDLVRRLQDALENPE